MDYYQVLGISRDSREKEIKAAFRKIALKYHPDRFGIRSISPQSVLQRSAVERLYQPSICRHSNASPQVKADVAQKFKAATEAYETLIDGKSTPLD